MNKIDLICLQTDELVLVRDSYLKQIGYCKQRHCDDEFVVHLENEVNDINLELIERGEVQ